MGNWISSLFEDSKAKKEFDALNIPSENATIEEMMEFESQLKNLQEKYPDFNSTSYRSQFDSIYQPKLKSIIKQLYNEAKSYYENSTVITAFKNNKVETLSQQDVNTVQNIIKQKQNEISKYYPSYNGTDLESLIQELNNFQNDLSSKLATILAVSDSMIKARDIFCNILCGYGLTLVQEVEDNFVEGYNEEIHNLLLKFSELQPILYNLSISEAKEHLLKMFEYYSFECYATKIKKEGENMFIKYKDIVTEFFNNSNILKSKDEFYKVGKTVLKKLPQHHIKSFAYYAKRHFPYDQGVLDVPSNYPIYNFYNEKIDAVLAVINTIIEITANGSETYYFVPIAEYTIYSDKAYDGEKISTQKLKSTTPDVIIDKVVKNVKKDKVNPYHDYTSKILIQATDSTISQRFNRVLSANTEQIQNFVKDFMKSTNVFEVFSNPHLFNSTDYFTYQPEANSIAGPKLVKSLYDQMIVKAMNYFVILPFEPLDTTYSINTYDFTNGCPEQSLNDFIYKF